MRFALILDLCQWQALTSNKWRSLMDTVEELPYLLLYLLERFKQSSPGHLQQLV